jgi:NAD(P)-dependent dehydrogenase (short-subunit alcohol dehydrogenase family)
MSPLSIDPLIQKKESAMTRITSPFQYRSTAADVIKGHDLRGKNVIITGANSGIGVETARAFAQAGADLTLAVRDVEKAQPLVSELREKTGNANLRAAALDLASLASVRKFAADFIAQGKPLHILINNAGVMATPFSRTADGFEMQFGTNHLGHFLLTVLLHPALKAGAPSRVVNVSSSAHHRSDINWDDVNYHSRPYDKWESYGQSKTANVLFTVGLARRWAGDGISGFALMPGGIMTNLQKHMPREEKLAAGFEDEQGNSNPMFKTVEQGASTTVWAAVGSELAGTSGLYLEDCQQAEPHEPDVRFRGIKDYALSVPSADRLWAMSESLVGLK